jgi:hypothetical protein
MDNETFEHYQDNVVRPELERIEWERLETLEANSD